MVGIIVASVILGVAIVPMVCMFIPEMDPSSIHEDGNAGPQYDA